MDDSNDEGIVEWLSEVHHYDYAIVKYILA